MVPADSHRVSRAPRYLGATRKEKGILRYRAVTFFGRPSQTVLVTLFSSFVRIRPDSNHTARTSSYSLWSCNPALSFRIARFRLFRVRSPLLAESLVCFLFLGVLRWFTSPRSLRVTMDSSHGKPIARLGFPHSDIPGSSIACISPRRFAAGCVLLRLLAPRHPHTCS
jgi:hypothetical protein